jgi:Na+/H+ antiporter NhaD/arsenite permease-like protein
MKKLVTFVGSLGTLLLSSPIVAQAAEVAGETANESAASNVPLWLCIPFACLLLCIAVFPLVKPEWWEKNRPYAVILWSVLFIVPFAILFGIGTAAETVLECVINDYLTFIVLLFGLFCVAGNIKVEGNLVGSPRVNVLLLGIGTLLSSWVGTTGASMLLVRPVIKMNSWRKSKAHIMVFFIFLISNIGGCLTPIGDPPLLMGFSRGVPFFWSLRLFPILIFNMVVLLIIFYLIDRHFYKKDLASGAMPEYDEKAPLLRIKGLHNLIFLVMIIAAVILSGVLPDVPFFQNAQGEVLGITIFREVTLTVPAIIEIVIILLAAFLSFKTTNPENRKQNHFTWGAIQEVAVLFIGIFITMQPALMILKSAGASLGLDQPFQMFWVTGALSSFLDNTPTYLVFLTTAGSMGFSSGVATTLGMVPVKMLMAISCGAVFMGANTYIGNAPNFMVKSISDENGIKMPSFFGYILWSLCILIPVFFLDMLVFFL